MKSIRQLCQEVKAELLQDNIDTQDFAIANNIFPEMTKEEVKKIGHVYINVDDNEFYETLHEFSKEDTKYSLSNVILTDNLNTEHSAKKFNLKGWWDTGDGYEYSPYGLSDNMSQIIEKYGEDVLIIAVPFYKKLQPAAGGFRFHKWGEYIGEFQDEVEHNEYIYDSNLDVIWSFHVHTKERLLTKIEE